MVIPEVVYDDEKHLLPLVEGREDFPLEDIWTHDRALLGILHPVHVVASYEFREFPVCFCSLHGQHLFHGRVSLRELQFPICKPLVHFCPFVQCHGVIYLHAQFAKVLLIGRLCLLRDNLLLMNVLLQGG